MELKAFLFRNIWHILLWERNHLTCVCEPKSYNSFAYYPKKNAFNQDRFRKKTAWGTSFTVNRNEFTTQTVGHLGESSP